MMGALLAAAALDVWPLLVLLVAIAAVILGVLVLRLHPFVALVSAALLAGGLADGLPADPKRPEQGQLVRAVELTAEGFGRTAGGVAIVIAMATIIGMALTESGAADKVVRRFLAVSGSRPAGISLAVVLATYLLSIPIFFDSMFMLMAPVAVALALRTGGHFTLYVLSICAGGTVTHALTIPHPGPIFMAENLGIDVGLSIWIGIVAGIIPVLAGWVACQWLDRLTPIPVRDTGSLSLADARTIMDRPESELPSLAAAVLPIIVPILLISAASGIDVLRQGAARDAAGWAAGAIEFFGGVEAFGRLARVIEFIGNKNVALIIGALLALVVLARQRRLSFAEVSRMTGKPLETAGLIVLITAAGGAFGFMLTQAGVGRALEGWVASTRGIDIVLLGYVVALVFRIAQGSATVAMQMASTVCMGLLPALECHPIYLFLAIGFGATGFSWMNDSGFWVVSRLAGFSERETLRTWTVLLGVISLVGIGLTFTASRLAPLAPTVSPPPPATAPG
jgi:gluconate:H+ symporter, GntP family